MASEVGHARNVQAFEELCSKVVGYGGVYKPSNTAIELAALQAKLTASEGAMDGVTNSFAGEKTSINDRQNLFKPLQPMVTRSVNYYASTGAADNAVKDAKSLKRKIDGKRASEKPVDDPATPGNESAATHSSAQTSYTQRVEHLDDLIALYSTDAKYAPNEADLTTGALTAYANSLKASNTDVINKETATTNARLVRTQVMYEPQTGLFKLQQLVKMYVKGLYGATSAEYKQISGLKFVNYEE